MDKVSLTADEAEVLFNHLDYYIIQEIKDSDDYDNMNYLVTLTDIYKRCKAVNEKQDKNKEG